MKIILDVSAAIALARGGSDSKPLEEAMSRFQEVECPDLFVAEASNTVWKIHRMGGVIRKDAEELLERTLALPDAYFPCLDFHSQALNLAWKAGTPVYDMFYLALAIQRHGTLATLDRKLQQICRTEGVPVIPN